jgi:hypothetical protein
MAETLASILAVSSLQKVTPSLRAVSLTYREKADAKPTAPIAAAAKFRADQLERAAFVLEWLQHPTPNAIVSGLAALDLEEQAIIGELVIAYLGRGNKRHKLTLHVRHAIEAAP